MKVISILSAALAALTVITFIGFSSGESIPDDQQNPGLRITKSDVFFDHCDSVPPRDECYDPLLY
jgi:hypothetical protein